MAIGTAALIAAAVVVAAGAAATAVVKKNAADKAASAQKKGVEQQNSLLKGNMNPDKLNALATRFDKDRAKTRLEFQKEIDPELAALRQKGKEELLAQANLNQETTQSGLVAKELFNEVKEADPRMQALKDSLITKAQQAIDAGPGLPIEYQRELVNAGVTEGFDAGIGASKDAIGSNLARTLGVAQFTLEQARQDQAIELAGAAQNITNARVNILATVFPKLRDLESVNRQDALINFQVGDNALPQVGLTGQDAVNIQIAKTKAKGALLQKNADIKAQGAVDQGQYTGALIGAGTSLVSGVLGAYAAPTGAVGTGANSASAYYNSAGTVSQGYANTGGMIYSGGAKR